MSVTSIADDLAVAATQVADVLRRSRCVVLLAHINPDADALGSALALGLALESLGVEAHVAFGFPVATPESLRELPGQHLIGRPVPERPDAVVSLDAASPGRLGHLERLLTSATTSIVIDHHASNLGFGKLNWIDPQAEATVVMVAELIDELGVEIDVGMAANLYAGLATDTVNFRFASGAGHALAARLVDIGVQASQVLLPITDSHPFAWLGMLGGVLSAATLDPAAAGGQGLVAVRVRLADAAGLRQEELDSIIDIVRTAQEAAVAAVIKETGPDDWQVSLRSRNGVNVGRVATALGGGGHPRAAGYSFTGDYRALFAELVGALDVA